MFPGAHLSHTGHVSLQKFEVAVMLGQHLILANIFVGVDIDAGADIVDLWTPERLCETQTGCQL